MTGGEVEEYLLLSGIQHFAFCRRQWALIHIEQQWVENVLTVEGDILHERAHDERFAQKRGDLLTLRGLRVFSHRLRAVGACDVVEFIRDPEGISLQGREGLWRPCPVEYKRGRPKGHDADELQLCAQAMCLEEMLLTDIPEGCLYYGESRKRTQVSFTPALREKVAQCFAEMSTLYARGHTPVVRQTKACKNCSLNEICLPALAKQSASEYVARQIRGDS